MTQRFGSFEEFWPFYMGEHERQGTRWLHFLGTGIALSCLLLSFWLSPWLAALAPVAGYAFAWFSHWAVEGNRPATFSYPLWSLRGDLKMFRLILTGQMGREDGRLMQVRDSLGASEPGEKQES